MRHLTGLLLALLVVGCGGTPTTSEPVAASIPSLEPALRTDAEQEALIRDGIEVVYSSDPQPDWFGSLHLVDGAVDLLVDGTSLFVAATSPEFAEAMCRDIAAIAFDDDAVPIGFRHVHIQVGEDIVADCDTRT